MRETNKDEKRAKTAGLFLAGSQMKRNGLRVAVSCFFSMQAVPSRTGSSNWRTEEEMERYVYEKIDGHG